MRLKQLESALSSVQREFPNPNITLEQYPTSPQLTAAVILSALERGDVGPGRLVIDLGCGTGMLAIGCALVDTDHVYGVDCDEAALERAQFNIQEAEMDDRISLIQAKVHLPISSVTSGATMNNQKGKRGGMGRGRGKGGRRGGMQRPRPPPSLAPPPASREPLDGNEGEHLDNSNALSGSVRHITTFPLSNQSVDTVVTNPPFGTKPDKAGIDMQFLLLACRLATRCVYSFHKTSTRDYILRTIQALDSVATVTVIAEMRFDLPQTYKFHQKASVDIAVDLIRVELRQSRTDGNDGPEPEVQPSGFELGSEYSDNDSEQENY